MILSSANSQQLSSDSTVIVPIKSLKKALLIKAERDDLKNQLIVARDSISIMDSIIIQQDGIILVLDSTRTILDDQIGDYQATITAKNGIIHEQDQKITSLERTVKMAYAAIVATAISFILVLI